MLSRLKDVNESVMLACWHMICQPHFTYLFGLFHLFLIINVIVTEVDATKVRCY